MGKRKLTLERRNQPDKTLRLGEVVVTPVVNAAYWAYRVVLTPRQAVVGFPKFSTIGIGFAVEEDWNTNLPYTSDTEKIFRHIVHNKGDDAIADEDVRAAIALIQAAVAQDRAAASEGN